jgi:hypothetical protein
MKPTLEVGICTKNERLERIALSGVIVSGTLQDNFKQEDTMSATCFGGCPECGDYDIMLNMQCAHYYVCHEHRTAWCIGSNLFSSWEYEDADTWQHNYALLQEYTKVEPRKNYVVEDAGDPRERAVLADLLKAVKL